MKEGLGTSFGLGGGLLFDFGKIAQHPSLREKLAESVDGPTAATHGYAQWDEDGKDEAGSGQSAALASHLPVVEDNPARAGAFTDNAGKVSAKPGTAGAAEVQLVVLAVQARIDPGKGGNKFWMGEIIFIFVRLFNTRIYEKNLRKA